MKFIDIINGALKSTTIQWAGIFGTAWTALLGLDWANVALPAFLSSNPWLVAGLGLAQSIMMVIKRAQTTESLTDKVKK